MHLEVTFRELEPSDALKARAEKKLGRIVKHLREPIEAHLVLSVHRHRQVAHLRVTAAGESFSVEEETDDMYASIDQLTQRVERLVLKHREKYLDRAHHGLTTLDGFQAGTADELPAEPAEPGAPEGGERGIA